jgi:hypothetical protein
MRIGVNSIPGVDRWFDRTIWKKIEALLPSNIYYMG